MLRFNLQYFIVFSVLYQTLVMWLKFFGNVLEIANLVAF